MIDWNKPIRFSHVQNGDNILYPPQLVGSFLDSGLKRRYVVVARNWIEAFSFLVYDDDGHVLEAVPEGATRASGILDATIINGDEIRKQEYLIAEGVKVEVTFDGDEAVRVKLA